MVAGQYFQSLSQGGTHRIALIERQVRNFMNFMTLPVVIYVGWWANHIIHHRGQLSTYLRAMNAHVPSIYGGSADEPFGAAATA